MKNLRFYFGCLVSGIELTVVGKRKWVKILCYGEGNMRELDILCLCHVIFCFLCEFGPIRIHEVLEREG